MNSYIYKCEIGQGNFSTVFKAVNISNSEVVAIKKINKTRLTKPLLKRVSKEIEILKSLNHINIISLKNYSIDDKNIYIITEYCDGGSLKDLIGRNMCEYDVRDIIRQLLCGLVYLDEKGILHRDIKPDNILITSDMIVKIIDFGFSSDDNNDLYSTICGTPMYMSPELLNYQQYTKKSDLWSIGVISYELFHQCNPFGKPKNIVELLENINNNTILYKSNITIYFLRFIHSLLKVDASGRPNLEELYNHDWFSVKIPKYLEKSNYTDDIFVMDDLDSSNSNSDYYLMTKEQLEQIHNKNCIDEAVDLEPIVYVNKQNISISSPIEITNNKINIYDKMNNTDADIYGSSPIYQYSSKLIKNIMSYIKTC
jgi:serine/threonine protein kinase